MLRFPNALLYAIRTAAVFTTERTLHQLIFQNVFKKPIEKSVLTTTPSFTTQTEKRKLKKRNFEGKKMSLGTVCPLIHRHRGTRSRKW